MVEKQEHMKLAEKSHVCEYCKESVELETGKEDYLQSEIDNSDIWIHSNCLERARMLCQFEWDKDY